jgi:hypothetical protein
MRVNQMPDMVFLPAQTRALGLYLHVLSVHEAGFDDKVALSGEKSVIIDHTRCRDYADYCGGPRYKYFPRVSALGKHLVPRDNIPRIPSPFCNNYYGSPYSHLTVPYLVLFPDVISDGRDEH